MNVEIRELDKSYKGKKFLFQYETTHYFDIEATEKEEEWGLRFIKKSFEKAIQKKFESVLLEDFLEDPMLLGAFKQDKLVGFIELSHEKWNNRLRISNIFVEKPYRYQGIGKILMDKAIEYGKNIKARAIVLETQSCNAPAIKFYRRCGFTLIGCDLTAYSNRDTEQKEVRLEMGRCL